jgi:acetyltransferase
VRPVRAVDPRALGDLWLAVVRAGGAVGFPVDAPEAEVRDAARQAADDVATGRLELLVATDAAGLAGAVFLRRGSGAVVAHRAEVLRLMVRPDLQGRGLGRALLDAAATHARALGLAQLLLSTRGGTSLPGYYAALGWTEVGRFPAALRVGPGDMRDEHWFQLDL